MSADAVCAVRRGLRMEFSRPRRPETPEQAGQRAPDDAGHGSRHGRGQTGRPRGRSATAPRPTSGDGGRGQPERQSDRADEGDGAAPGEAAP